MNAFHVVHITTRGYHHRASFCAPLHHAAAIALECKRISMATILRDGATGRRYTLAECERMARGLAP